MVHSQDYNAYFKSIYYTLYTNDNASRAETIVSDISKLLLFKLIVEKKDLIIDYCTGEKIIQIIADELPEYAPRIKKFSLSDSSIRSVMRELNAINISHAPSHIVGDAFQTIIGPRIRGDKGQFFTPKELVECMVSIANPRHNSTIIDPACGTGGFLTEAYTQLQTHDSNSSCQLIGIDKDSDMVDIAIATVSVVAGNDSLIYNSNSLEILNPENELNHLIGTADCILTNPPFGSKIGVTDKKILQLYEFGHNWAFSKSEQKWYKLDSLVKNQAPQILFIELCVNLLRSGGRLAIVLPEGIFGNKSFGYIWDYLKRKGKIEAMIDCPRNTFQPSTDTKTNVLFFKKDEPYDDSVLIAVAKECGHDKRGRITNNEGKPWKNDFLQISQDYKKKKTPIWHKAFLTGSYYVPRYLASKAEYTCSNGFITIGDMLNNGMLNKKKGKEIGSESYGTGDIPYIRTSDINNFEISADPTNSVSNEIYYKYSAQQDLKVGDILLITDGRYRIGKTAIITEYTIKCLIQSHILILSLDDTAPFTPYEFLFCLNTAYVQEQIRNMIFIQSTLGTLGNRFSEIQIPLPNRSNEWQKKIHAFQKHIEMRAKCLNELKKYEYDQFI